MPCLVIALFVLVFCFGKFIPLPIKEQFYAISLLIKDLIIFVLPILIFSFVLNGILNLKSGSVKVVFLLVSLVCLSNFVGFWLSYIFAAPILKSGAITISKLSTQKVLVQAWNFKIISFIKNDIAMLSGVLVGIIGGFLKNRQLEMFSEKIYNIANFILKKGICPILPLFVLGFIIKMQHEETLYIIVKEYSRLLACLAIFAYGYMFFLVFLLSDFNFAKMFEKFKNLLPGILIGLLSMSSAAAIPHTIAGSEKNLKNKEVAKFAISATANMHLLGDCFALPLIGFMLMISFGYGFPTPAQFLTFSLYGVVAKFAAAGIPGGSAIIFAPLFEKIFGFSAPMVAAVTAIYVVFDPIATSANVFGHGVFAMLYEKISNIKLKNNATDNV
jgi:Na+/H+-dicarboxylate symporter